MGALTIARRLHPVTHSRKTNIYRSTGEMVAGYSQRCRACGLVHNTLVYLMHRDALYVMFLHGARRPSARHRWLRWFMFVIHASVSMFCREDSRLTTTASNPVLPFPVSQCGTGYQETTARFDLLRFDFTAPVQETVASVRTAIKHANPVQVATPSSPAANIDVLVLWLDWELDVGGHYVVSGAPNSGALQDWPAFCDLSHVSRDPDS